jgi:hypothetical protein
LWGWLVGLDRSGGGRLSGSSLCLVYWLSLTFRRNLPVDNSQNRTSKAKNRDT